MPKIIYFVFVKEELFVVRRLSPFQQCPEVHITVAEVLGPKVQVWFGANMNSNLFPGQLVRQIAWAPQPCAVS